MKLSSRLLSRISTRLSRFGAACCAGVLLILSTPALAAPTLKAAPQTVAIPTDQKSGKATITWDAEAANPNAEVWFKIGNGDEERFSGEAKGTKTATILPDKTYTFKLYKDENGQDVLATVVVTGAKAGGEVLPPPDDEEAPDDIAPADDDAAPDAVPDAPPVVSFAGTWQTLAGGTHEYTVRLQQVGNKVTGSYSPSNGKIFDGIVVGRKLTFNWTQAPDWEGTSEFTLDEDGKGFKGSTTALKPQQFTHSWNSFVPEPLALAGVWETTSNDAPFTLTLQQEGNKITGSYTPGNGKLEGTLKGNILRFTWTSDGGEGSGRFVFDKSETAFSGSYSNSDDPEQTDGLWSGTRKMGGSGGKTTVSFAGTWVQGFKIGDRLMTITYKLEQTGKSVTGYYLTDTEGAEKVLIEGVVAGNTLIYRTIPGGKDEIKEFVMAGDGKSFTGNWGKLPITVIFVGR